MLRCLRMRLLSNPYFISDIKVSKDEEDKSMGEDSDVDKGSDESEIDSKFEEEN